MYCNIFKLKYLYISDVSKYNPTDKGILGESGTNFKKLILNDVMHGFPKGCYQRIKDTALLQNLNLLVVSKQVYKN